MHSKHFISTLTLVCTVHSNHNNARRLTWRRTLFCTNRSLVYCAMHNWQQQQTPIQTLFSIFISFQNGGTTDTHAHFETNLFRKLFLGGGGFLRMRHIYEQYPWSFFLLIQISVIKITDIHVYSGAHTLTFNCVGKIFHCENGCQRRSIKWSWISQIIL